jgi:hypothetical protein
MNMKKPQGKSAPVSPPASTTKPPTAGRKPKPGSFDRIRPPEKSAAARVDPQGKQALFSGADNPPSLGSVAVDCAKCHRRSVISLTQMVQLSLPGVHAPVPGKGHRAFMKCPACGKRSWLGVTVGR